VVTVPTTEPFTNISISLPLPDSFMVFHAVELTPAAIENNVVVLPAAFSFTNKVPSVLK
jgi:hypothetical protein